MVILYDLSIKIINFDLLNIRKLIKFIACYSSPPPQKKKMTVIELGIYIAPLVVLHDQLQYLIFFV
jgi:hypothetical protein